MQHGGEEKIENTKNTKPTISLLRSAPVPRYTDPESPARVIPSRSRADMRTCCIFGMHVCAVSCEWRDARRAHVKLNVRVAVFGDGRAHSVALVDSVGGDPDD